MKGIKPLVAGLVCLLLVGPIWLILEALRIRMIVELGIIATYNIRTVLVGAFVVAGLAAIVWGLTQLLPDLVKNSSEVRLRAYRKTSSPEKIREQLILLRGYQPQLSGRIGQLLEQLDEMASQFSRFDRLINSNEAEGVVGGLVALKEIEGTVCANINGAINIIIAADNPKTNVSYDQSIERIERVVTANSRALGKGNQFLLEIAENISRVADDTALTDGWVEKIRAENRKSLIGAEEPR